jgi:transcriptional regulator with XRE-family HTH domain
MTGQRLGERVGKGQSWVAKVERGRLLPQVVDVERWADATRAPAAVKAALVEQVSALHTDARSWRVHHRPSFRRRQQELRRLEAEAATMRLFQPNVVPGLLQTAEYARHVLQAEHFRIGNLADAVAGRIERQTTLYDQSKRFHFIITEAALRWRLCPVNAHLAQLDRIASLSTLANLRIGIIPWSAELPPPPANMFLLLDERVAMVETMTTLLTLTEQEVIEDYARAFATLESLALYDEDARAVLARIADDLRRLGN